MTVTIWTANKREDEDGYQEQTFTNTDWFKLMDLANEHGAGIEADYAGSLNAEQARRVADGLRQALRFIPEQRNRVVAKPGSEGALIIGPSSTCSTLWFGGERKQLVEAAAQILSNGEVCYG